MRPAPSSFPFRSALTKSLSVALCLALVGLDAGPVFARNNDDYQNNAYSSNYGPRGGYSASNFELQMQQARARMQSFVAPPVQFFDSSRLSTTKLSIPAQPPIRFQYSPQGKAPDLTSKPLVKLDTFTPVQKPTFIQNVGHVFKGVGNAIATAVKQVGSGIADMAQKIFSPNKQETPITPQAKEAMRYYTNLKEISPGVLQTQGGQTHGLGQAWEPGSKFKPEGNNLRLIEGTAFNKSFGGISRVDGGYLPVRFADDGGKVKPVGLDFPKMVKDTVLRVESPVNIEGFGKIQGGNMVFKGTVNTPNGPMGGFQFQGAQVELDSTMAGATGMSTPANILRATFSAEAAVMSLNSAVVQKGDKTLFVSQDRAPVEVTETTKAATDLSAKVGTLQAKVSTLDQQLNQNALAARTVAKDMGYSTENLGVKPEDAATVAEVRILAVDTMKLNNDIEAGGYEDAQAKVNQLQTKLQELTPRVESLENSAVEIKQVAKSLIMEKNARREIADSTKPKNILAWVGHTTVGIVAGAARAVVDVVRTSIELLGKLPIVGSMVKAAWRAKSEIVGDVFTVLSGDFLDKQPAIQFDKDPSKPAVITVNGIQNSRSESKRMNNAINRAFGVESSSRISNDSHGPKGVLDFIQIIGHEYLGAYDRPVQNMAKAIRAGIAQKGEVYVVAHSQGTAIFAKSLELLSASERSKIHYYGAGSEWFVDSQKAGLASGENVWNRKDLIPSLGNNARVTNWIVPGEADRKFRQTTRIIGDDEKWRQISVEWPGVESASNNHHNFSIYYQQDMENWAKRQLASSYLAGRN
jgi:outer membrane murein-binding lipoprotein Lpp